MKINLYLITFFSAINLLSSAQDARIYSTYFGGQGNESGFAAATDDSGNVFMAGITSSGQGIAASGFQNTFGGGVVDAFLVKINSVGNRVWATYYGGTGEENNFLGGKLGIATDLWGNVYLAGLTNSTTNMASGGYQNTAGGLRDAYLVKFGPGGNRIWATYYGDVEVDYGYNVATDKAGNVYLTGITSSTAGIASGGFQNTLGGASDAFLAKFDSSGNRIWATYYGGSGSDEGYSITTDDSANVYLAGSTNSTAGIASGGFQNSYGGGGYDAFLVKFDSTGSRMWATYYGGSGDELMLFSSDMDVEVDQTGNVYLTGITTSTNAIAAGGFQNTIGGGSDAYLVKFNSAGSRIWSTYYGGSGDDKGYSIAIDATGNIHLAGRTTSITGIATGGFSNTSGGSDEGFLVKFMPDGSRVCATYYGGNDYDTFDGLAIDHADNLYASGNTASTSGISSGGFQNIFGGGSSDAYLVKFHSCDGTSNIEYPIADETIGIFPNPSEGKFYISKEDCRNASIEIHNIMGKLILRSDNFNGIKEIDLSNYGKGVYFLKIRQEEKEYKGKIVIH